MAKEPNNQSSGSNSPQNEKKNIIIIKKIKKHHGGHHGGAWKVAYADFVTAMMAFFLLLWLISSVSQDKLQGISEYFLPETGLINTKGYSGDNKTAPSTSQRVQLNSGSSSQGSTGSEEKSDKESLVVDSDATKLVSVMNNLSKTMDGSSEMSNLSENVLIDRVPEGLRIQLVDSLNRSVFKPGSSEIEPYMAKFLYIVSDIIKTVPNYISISGHTSVEADPEIKSQDQWTLSLQRSDTIRKFFEERIKKDQVLRLIGRANTDPFDPNDPQSPKNSRIVIILLNTSSLGKMQNVLPNVN
ncbi:MAG: motility protein MotB [Alphaproteobacteria bacterium]|nr:motility protein MotB [Alphaproteobacteria bacterium]